MDNIHRPKPLFHQQHTKDTKKMPRDIGPGEINLDEVPRYKNGKKVPRKYLKIPLVIINRAIIKDLQVVTKDLSTYDSKIDKKP